MRDLWLGRVGGVCVTAMQAFEFAQMEWKRRVDFCVLVGCARALRNIAPRLRSTFRLTPSSSEPFSSSIFRGSFFGFCDRVLVRRNNFWGRFRRIQPAYMEHRNFACPLLFSPAACRGWVGRNVERLLLQWPGSSDSPFTYAFRRKLETRILRNSGVSFLVLFGGCCRFRNFCAARK